MVIMTSCFDPEQAGTSLKLAAKCLSFCADHVTMTRAEFHVVDTPRHVKL